MSSKFNLVNMISLEIISNQPIQKLSNLYFYFIVLFFRRSVSGNVSPSPTSDRLQLLSSFNKSIGNMRIIGPWLNYRGEDKFSNLK